MHLLRGCGIVARVNIGHRRIVFGLLSRRFYAVFTLFTRHPHIVYALGLHTGFTH